MQLREYRNGDLDAMVALDELCFALPFRFSRALMRQFVEAKRARVTIADADGELAGFCVLHIDPFGHSRVGYLVTLDVAAAHRRQRLATRLMAQAEVQAVEAGCEAMVLHVFTGNRAAILFYELCGFVQTDRATDFYSKGLDALVYRKPLSPSA
jgi:ribosomal-protein-alanine N-acetyltransferase